MTKANDTYKKKAKRGLCWFIKVIQPTITFKKHLCNKNHQLRLWQNLYI